MEKSAQESITRTTLTYSVPLWRRKQNDAIGARNSLAATGSNQADMIRIGIAAPVIQKD